MRKISGYRKQPARNARAFETAVGDVAQAVRQLLGGLAPGPASNPTALLQRRRTSAAAESIKVGDTLSQDTMVGPLASSVQFERKQALIQKGIDEGARLETGGVGRPA